MTILWMIWMMRTIWWLKRASWKTWKHDWTMYVGDHLYPATLGLLHARKIEPNIWLPRTSTRKSCSSMNPNRSDLDVPRIWTISMASYKTPPCLRTHGFYHHAMFLPLAIELYGRFTWSFGDKKSPHPPKQPAWLDSSACPGLSTTFDYLRRSAARDQYSHIRTSIAHKCMASTWRGKNYWVKAGWRNFRKDRLSTG